MLKFQPYREMFLQIKRTTFEFMPHPLFPDDPQAIFVLEGGTAFIYQLRDLEKQRLYALKVFKPAYRDEHSMRVTEFLVLHPELRVFQIDGRICLTRYSAPDLVQTFPELEYAILMPWNTSLSWAGMMLNPQVSACYSREQALTLARATANALWNLEALGVAHADLAGSNLVPSQDGKQLQLLDPEGMFLPGKPLPKKLSQGSPGYQHRHLGPQGQCCREGDRFAGAILLTELLTWWNPRVRARVEEHAETLFRQEELQTRDAPCWPVVRDTLYTLSPKLLALFDQVWFSQTLADCPPFSAWSLILLSDFTG
jgi:serine/threonine protein kinase